MKKFMLLVFVVFSAVFISLLPRGVSAFTGGDGSSLLIDSFHGGAQTSPTIDCNISTLSAGCIHTVGLKENGTVVAVGYNGLGALNVSGWTNIKSISARQYHTVGLQEDGTVVAVGYNGFGGLNVSGWTNIKSISAGLYHTVGLKEDGTVVGAGPNGDGQLNVSGWTNIKSISAGQYHTVGLKEDGTVLAVGENLFGQLNVSGWTNIKSISAGNDHTVGLKEDGTVVAAGSNKDGELNVSGWTNIKAISAGGDHTVGLKGDGTVVAVGENYWGELNVSGWTNIKSISAGGDHTVGLKEDGTVVAVGDNTYGQLNVSGWTNIRQPCHSPTDNTPPGTNVSVTPDPNVTMTFNEVTGTGNTTVNMNDKGPLPPSGFQLLGNYYVIETTATYTGPITLALEYDDTGLSTKREENLKLKRWVGAGWDDITTSVDTIKNIIHGSTPGLSLFAIMFPDNLAPGLEPIGDKSVDEGQLLSFNISASDPDRDTLTYSATGLPSGAGFDASTFSWTPGYNQAGSYQITFTVSDGPLTASEAISITVANVNQPPVLASIGNKSIDEGQALGFTISATDPDGTALTYSAVDLPGGATLDTATGAFSWTPGYDQEGRYQVTFTVSDGPLTASEVITITVTSVNRPPVLVPIGNKSVDEGQLLSFTISATDPDNDPLTYSASGLPDGASVNASTGAFSWTPGYDRAGRYDVTFSVSDGTLTASEAITITIVNANRPPVLASIGDKSVVEGQLLSFAISATDPDGNSLTYSASGLPGGASFDASTRTFSWTPGYNQAGGYTVTFVASDGSLADPETITINVINLDPAAAISALIGTIKAMNLKPIGIEESLVAKLDAALASLNRGQKNTAKNQLGAFINECQAQKGKALSIAQADQLIGEANKIIAALQY